jgi:MFS superfamily sulfate permease-like transporter
VSLLVAGLTVVTAVALLPLFRDLPQAALGAVVISAVLGFLNLAAMERVRRLRHDSFVVALVVLVAVLVLGVLQGLILGVVISVGVFLVRSSRPGSSVRTGPGRPARPVVHPRARHRERERGRLAAFRAGGPGRRPVAGRGPRPGEGPVSGLATS